MRVLVVDDEVPARARLIRLLESLGPPYEVVGEAANGIEALACCRRLEVELLLLDVRMPGMDGLELAAELGRWQPPPAIIFTTAYSEHALDAFDSQAVDYLLKPVRAERLERALERARSPTRAQLQVLTGADEPHLSYSLGGSLHRLALSEVLYFRAEQKYVVVRHRGGEGLLEETLKSLEERFAPYLIRIHRNALVSRGALSGLVRREGGRVFATLRDCGQELEVSRRHLPALRRLLKSG
ncbi:MAG: DNA-binding response regulator [Candidatus Sedimenticola endophacoides]|uniref:DNA-binding response regulator n=1 Tax=Candidatus Sedimenticola endophacoides TaxID=2548426 RepID=A0A6N4DXR3_9GAMM|nr:MAG: DNA-binding response regulator [Candidatus Sedimenticola endophacoides]OQX36392.1 MAG: DNA-binding response regulator [Candidatus Sedimenticola endophacoides]OQX41480.1 MAG: DNA-binding response regulator [Candidatus Sedimenticola endophacoides]PUE00777.1 MAG: DNA-binding response regulator [Candidatus Sedimenticola endophacoides]PUE03764.1 MAG: DNA-binding response regulator [Candidatus Sedimenticola endophacoides]